MGGGGERRRETASKREAMGKKGGGERRHSFHFSGPVAACPFPDIYNAKIGNNDEENNFFFGKKPHVSPVKANKTRIFGVSGVFFPPSANPF